MLMLGFHSVLQKLFQKTCACHGSSVSWHLWTFLAQLTKERKPDRIELYVWQRVLRVQRCLGMKRNDPVKCITITCHYSVLLSPLSYDGKTHNDFCRFLGFRLEIKKKNSISPHWTLSFQIISVLCMLKAKKGLLFCMYVYPSHTKLKPYL